MQDIPNPSPSTVRDAADSAGERRGIQSIEVGGSLLSALVREGKPMMLKDLAREAGMPAAKAHPYLVSFGKLGLVEQDALTGRYGLGPFALQMGLTALHGLDPIKAALPEAARLADDIDLNVAIAVWGNHGPTVVHIAECSRQIHINMRPGTVMTPLLLSATGRVFAAFLPQRIVAPVLAAEAVAVSAPPLEMSPGDVHAVLDEIRGTPEIHISHLKPGAGQRIIDQLGACAPGRPLRALGRGDLLEF